MSGCFGWMSSSWIRAASMRSRSAGVIAKASDVMRLMKAILLMNIGLLAFVPHDVHVALRGGLRFSVEPCDDVVNGGKTDELLPVLFDELSLVRLERHADLLVEELRIDVG